MATNVCNIRFIILVFVSAATVSAANYLTVDFTKKLDVGSLTSKTYTDFLVDLRKTLAATYSRNVPVLPVYENDNLHGFDINLISGTIKVPVRIRTVNLYVIGYEMQAPTKKWLEFGKKAAKPKPPQFIKDSEYLEFEGSYPALEGIVGSVTNMEINRKKLNASVFNLASSVNKRDRAEALTVVIQMISEAARFLDISNHFASTLEKNAKLPAWMRYDLENNWQEFSTMILRIDTDPTCPFTPPVINNKKIATVDELRGYFGILYRKPITLIPCPGSLYDEFIKSVFKFEARNFGPKMVVQA